jgi:hypothetical protein
MIKAKIGSATPVKAAVRLVDGIQAGWSVWREDRAYLPLEKVSRLGSSYICTNGCTGVDPALDVGDGVEGDCWLLIARKGDDGEGIESIDEVGGGEEIDGGRVVGRWKDYRITYASGKTLDYRVFGGADGKQGPAGAGITNIFFKEATEEGNVYYIQVGQNIYPFTAPKGPEGDDGVSPTVTVTPIANGHRITITDATGQKSFDVMDGEDGNGGGGTGDMMATVYDPQGKATDIFAYVDEKVNEINGGSSRLPSGYTELEYIESTGTQYINTGLVLNDGFTAKMGINFSVIEKECCVIGIWQGDQRRYYGKISNWYVGAPNLYTAQAPEENTDLEIEVCTTSDKYLKINGEDKTLTSASTEKPYTDSGLPLFLLSINVSRTARTPAAAKLYYCRIWDANNALVGDFVPCVNADGDIGVYDLVQQKFLGNAGDGVFTGESKTEGGGASGATFYPSVDTDGNLSWTNDGGLPNPNPVNIKGKDGAAGKNATINGVNALKIQGGDGIEAAMSGSTLTIKAKNVEEWTFTVEGEDGVDTTVTKKVVLV